MISLQTTRNGLSDRWAQLYDECDDALAVCYALHITTLM